MPPRAAWPIGVLFGVSLAVLITLVGPLLLFNPWFVSGLQQRHAVADAFDVDQAAIDAVTGQLLADIAFDGPFTASLDGTTPLLDASEQSHMTDVSGLVRMLAGVVAVALVVGAMSAFLLRREPRRQGRIMIGVAGAIGAAAIGIGLVFALAFDTAFTIFHKLFFPPGTWQFTPGSNLITLFPEPFWFDASLVAGVAIVIGALVVALIGFARWRSDGRSDARSALL